MKLERPQALILLGLIVSVLVNLFLVGFLVASHPQFRSREKPVVTSVPGPQNEQGRAPMRLLFAGHRQQFGEARRDIRAARIAVSDALLAEPFVAADLEAALKELQDRSQNAQTMLHQVLLERAPELTAEQRRSLAQAHRLWSGDGDGPRRRKHRGHRGFGGGRRPAATPGDAPMQEAPAPAAAHLGPDGGQP